MISLYVHRNAVSRRKRLGKVKSGMEIELGIVLILAWTKQAYAARLACVVSQIAIQSPRIP